MRTSIEDIYWQYEAELGDLYETKSQEITDAYLDDLADHRLASKAIHNPDNWQKLCSIPVIFVEKWLREGFDIWRESPRAIVKRLHQENLEKFLATHKRV